MRYDSLLHTNTHTHTHTLTHSHTHTHTHTLTHSHTHTHTHTHTLTHSHTHTHTLTQVFRDFGIGYVLNVTPKCPNHFEDRNIVYKRIVAADTGSQKLSHNFMEAFEFIGTTNPYWILYVGPLGKE